MTIDDIKTLIAADESRTLELKKTTGELKDGIHTACAFLNTEGGWLIFGVAPKSLKIIGQEVTDKTQQEIAQALAGLGPAIDVHVNYVDVPEYPGNKVIAMHFDGWVWGERPHTFHGCPYYKVESTTKVMPLEMYDERIRAHQPQIYSWESQTADSITLADLNEKHIRGCIRLGVEGGRIPASAMNAPIEDTLANGFFRLKPDYINPFPVPNQLPCEIVHTVEILTDYIMFVKSSEEPISDLVSNKFISDYFEHIIDGCIFELYFPKHMQEYGLDIATASSQFIQPIDHLTTAKEKQRLICDIFNQIKKTDNQVRDRLELFSLRIPDILKPIIE